MAILGRFNKQPAEVMDYQFDFTAWLADRGDTIAGTPTVTAALTKGTSSSPLVISGIATALGIVRFFASGGSDKCVWEITCTFVSSGGRTKQDEMLITVKET